MGTVTEFGEIRVFLLDGHEAYLTGIARVIDAEPDMEVVGGATVHGRTLAALAECRPDLAVLDICPDGPSGANTGLDVCRMIRATHPEVACLMLTSFTDDHALVEAGLAGARGLILKQIRGSELLSAIRVVAGGGNLIDDTAIRSARSRLQL